VPVLKTAYDLACERGIIAPKFSKKEEKPVMDFISIPEFEDKENKAIDIRGFSDDGEYAEETKPIGTIEKERDVTKTFEDKNMEALLHGSFSDFTGFSRINRTLAFGLSNRNVRVRIEDISTTTHINQSTQDILKELSNVEVSEHAPKIFSVTVPINMIHTGKKILFTMIENSNGIHKDYREKLNLFDEIWVPTNYNKNIFEDNKVYPPIHVMPLGVDADRYKPGLEKMRMGLPKDNFVFLSVFRWSYRKRPDILIRAFLEEFSSDEPVSLLIVSRAVEYDQATGEQKIIEEYSSIRSFVEKKDQELPHIALYTKPIPEKNMPRVYNTGDAFCLISEGEGFGLPFIEAGICGLPIIASNCSGQTDYLNKDNSYLVEPERYVSADINGKLSRMAKLCHFYENQSFPEFGEASINQTKEHMRYIYENYDSAKQKAKQFGKEIKAKYTWNNMVDKIYNRLEEM